MIYQIVINEENIVEQWSIGGYIPNGIDVDDIPQAVMDCPMAYKYIEDEFVANPDYVEPTVEEVTDTIPQMAAKIEELQMSMELLILDTL